MLLPSAIPCDSSHAAPGARYQSSPSAIASPPLSPSHAAINGLFSTCRVLQSMLIPSTPPPTTHELPSPPTTHSEIASPFKLRLRARRSVENDAAADSTPRKRITKRAAPPPRGLNKRRRALDDDLTRDAADSEDNDVSPEIENEQDRVPSTPKRARLAPPTLPLGLERSDFHALDLNFEKDQLVESVETDGAGEEKWSSEDDSMLVELLLEKLRKRLSKTDLQDCARSLGRDRGSCGRRWKSLMESGEVGLKRKQRARFHGSWR